MTLLSDASHEEKAPLEETRARWQTVTGQQAGTFGVATIANNPNMRGMVFDRKPVVEVVKIGSEGDGDIVADLLKEMMQNKSSTFIAIYFFSPAHRYENTCQAKRDRDRHGHSCSLDDRNRINRKN